MAFLECEVFFFGVVRRKGGKRSNNDEIEGIHDVLGSQAMDQEKSRRPPSDLNPMAAMLKCTDQRLIQHRQIYHIYRGIKISNQINAFACGASLKCTSTSRSYDHLRPPLPPLASPSPHKSPMTSVQSEHNPKPR